MATSSRSTRCGRSSGWGATSCCRRSLVSIATAGKRIASPPHAASSSCASCRRFGPLPERALLELLLAEGLELAVATSPQENEVRAPLAHARVAYPIHAAASSRDAERSQPGPD